MSVIMSVKLRRAFCMMNIIYSHMRCKGRFSLIVRNLENSVQENVSFTLIVRKSAGA